MFRSYFWKLFLFNFHKFTVDEFFFTSLFCNVYFQVLFIYFSLCLFRRLWRTSVLLLLFFPYFYLVNKNIKGTQYLVTMAKELKLAQFVLNAFFHFLFWLFVYATIVPNIPKTVCFVQKEKISQTNTKIIF
jgi:hypothetical protein